MNREMLPREEIAQMNLALDEVEDASGGPVMIAFRHTNCRENRGAKFVCG